MYKYMRVNKSVCIMYIHVVGYPELLQVYNDTSTHTHIQVLKVCTYMCMYVRCVSFYIIMIIYMYIYIYRYIRIS